MNVVTLDGRLTADPDIRTVTVSGAQRTTTRLGLAAPARYYRAAEPVYTDVAVWGRAAEGCPAYLRRGRRIASIGRLDLARWTDGNDTAQRLHRIVAHIQFLDNPRRGEESQCGPTETSPAQEPAR